MEVDGGRRVEKLPAASRDPEAAPKTDTPYSPTLCWTEAKASVNALWVGCRTGPLLCCSNLSGGPHLHICLGTSISSLKGHQEDDTGHGGCGQQAQPLSAVWP